MPKYPTRDEIWEIFKHLGTGEHDKFFAYVSPNVQWTVMGTSPLSQTFTSLDAFREGTLARLRKILKEQLRMVVKNVIGGGDQEWSSSEMVAEGAECWDGQPYNMTYNWVCRWDESWTIVEVRAYLDSEQLTRVLRDNECPKYAAKVEKYT